jgi:hypothetical protein
MRRLFKLVLCWVSGFEACVFCGFGRVGETSHSSAHLSRARVSFCYGGVGGGGLGNWLGNWRRCTGSVGRPQQNVHHRDRVAVHFGRRRNGLHLELRRAGGWAKYPLSRSCALSLARLPSTGHIHTAHTHASMPFFLRAGWGGWCHRRTASRTSSKSRASSSRARRLRATLARRDPRARAAAARAARAARATARRWTTGTRWVGSFSTLVATKFGCTAINTLKPPLPRPPSL